MPAPSKVQAINFNRLTKNGDFSPRTMWKIISWNVNGLRSLFDANRYSPNPLIQLVADEKPDVLCLQETKLSDQNTLSEVGCLDGYTFVDSVCSTRKGYSGTRTYVKTTGGLSAVHRVGMGNDCDPEGRIVTTTCNNAKLTVVNSYIPNAGMKLERLEARLNFDAKMRQYLTSLSQQHASMEGCVIWTGDLNVASTLNDRYFSKSVESMEKDPGFTTQERVSYCETLAAANMVDTFRLLYPEARNVYTSWTSRYNAKKAGHGWRLDYFAITKRDSSRVVDSFMLDAVAGSDHCPIVLLLRK